MWTPKQPLLEAKKKEEEKEKEMEEKKVRLAGLINNIAVNYDSMHLRRYTALCMHITFLRLKHLVSV